MTLLSTTATTSFFDCAKVVIDEDKATASAVALKNVLTGLSSLTLCPRLINIIET